MGAEQARRRFEGRSAIVTGGGRGLGRAVAAALAAEGAAVVVMSRTEAEVVASTDAICAAGGRAVAVPGDVARPQDVARCVDTAVRELGGVDVLVNCAGVFAMEPSATASEATLRRMLDTNVVGTFAMTQAAGRHMLRAGAGKIVNFASLLSFTAFPERAAYAASKAGVLQLTRVMGVEWAPHGVNVNAIAPGMIRVETPHPGVQAGRLSDDQILRRIPAGRRGEPRDVVGPTLFLCSSDADYVFGQTLVVDGGWLSYGYL